MTENKLRGISDVDWFNTKRKSPKSFNEFNDLIDLKKRQADGNYDGSVSYVSSIADVVLTNTGFGYQDGDTVAVEGGTVSDTLGDEVSQGIGQAEVELIIEDGLVAGANVINGGFGFTSIPDLVINSDTGSGARLTPVLRFTKIEDATELAQISQDAVVTVISCIEK